MKRARSRKPHFFSERGVIAVEMALTLPLLVWLVMGVIDLGLMSRQHQVVQNAAREGARFASLPGSRIDTDLNPGFSANDIKTLVAAYAAREGVTVAASDITVTQGHSLSVGSLTVFASRVTASTTYQFITPGMSQLLGTITLSGEGIYKNLF